MQQTAEYVNLYDVKTGVTQIYTRAQMLPYQLLAAMLRKPIDWTVMMVAHAWVRKMFMTSC